MIEWLKQGDFAFANPSSLHASGRKAKKQLHEVQDYLLTSFGLKDSHEIIFHSGATEGINMILRGLSQCSLQNQKAPVQFFYAPTDHSVVTVLAEELSQQGHHSFPILVDHQGDFSEEPLINQIKANNPTRTIINYTFVNNETGVVWPLELAEKIKKETGAFIHVDAVQAPGKISNYDQLSPELDAYTFSGHKFGALKGIGFTFIKKGLPCIPLIKGGGQQKGWRSGTENTFGIYSLKLALEELKKNFDFEELLQAKLSLETQLKNFLGDRLIIVAEKAKWRNANTITLILKNAKSDLVQAACDMSGIEVSSGSACSSGSMNPNRVLMAMGFDEACARCGLRLSFSPYLNQRQAEEYFQGLSKVFAKFKN